MTLSGREGQTAKTLKPSRRTVYSYLVVRLFSTLGVKVKF
jgi:hypothetical protein